MTHWHIHASCPSRGVFADSKYENASKSISDYVELVYGIYTKKLDESDKNIYLSNMLNLSETAQYYHIYTESPSLILSWKDCYDDPCTFATYN